MRLTVHPTASPLQRPPGRVRIVTAASLFDGHDAAIHIVRRLLQSQGAEVIHLGHDRPVGEIATAAIQEDAHAVAVSSYQGGHLEFFRYLVDELRRRGAPEIRIYGGGGGTITPSEIEALESQGVSRIFSPEDGRELGLDGMIAAILDECRGRTIECVSDEPDRLVSRDALAIARTITWLEEHGHSRSPSVRELRERLERMAESWSTPVVGFTGTGGAGKSTVIDELIRRFRIEFPQRSIGLVLVDPSRRRTGGALLGDRIRMNAIHDPEVYVRSMATRQAHLALSEAVRDAVRVLKAARFDLIFVETAGIGQSDSEIVDLVDVSLYTMTPEYGAPSQLEKIDMIDLADVVVLNKFDRQGGPDALRDVRKQWRRTRETAALADAEIPVFSTIARQWDDPGTDQLYEHLRERVVKAGGVAFAGPPRAVVEIREAQPLLPASRTRYLAEIAETVRAYRNHTESQAERASDAYGIARALGDLDDPPPGEAQVFPASALAPSETDPVRHTLRQRYNAALEALDPPLREELADWPATRARYAAPDQEYEVRGRAIRVENQVETLAHSKLPRVATPRARDWGEWLRYLRLENLPGRFPFTAGVFSFKRPEEGPARMFAGEGGPERTNRRFHYLSAGQPAKRLSTAFDSVTLYGRDPNERPDIFGKVGNSGVSVCSLDDAKKLYSGLDLCDPATSASMTINGPAPIVLAFFLNAAVDQQVERHLRETGQLETVRERHSRPPLPSYAGELPEGHNGLGLGLLGIPGRLAVPGDAYARIEADVLRRVRGTVQADILKEDQAQNTCIFSTEFALRMMGDIQEYFVAHDVRNFYSVSISGYHIAEAGANPISQLAFTLSNGFTIIEYYLARGMNIDEFAPNLSFFFSNGMDPEYTVIGRVARRIWARAMRERYGANRRSQMLKYHIQTSGRSLHAQEIQFNDIRTTLQALYALFDNCNSLHTNAYDEAVTTPTQESVRRAVAIQMIINKEFGLNFCENPWQGSFIVDELTELVEEAVYREFERISDRGGVLGAMDTMYQRSKIQDESLYYESLKHDGTLPIVGVNTFLPPDGGHGEVGEIELMRSTQHEKDQQVKNVQAFRLAHRQEGEPRLLHLQQVARERKNTFEALIEAAKACSLGSMSHSLYDVGGEYRRNM